MPRGPRGERRPADVIGNAVHVMKIATGEIEESAAPKSAAAELGSKGGGIERDLGLRNAGHREVLDEDVRRHCDQAAH